MVSRRRSSEGPLPLMIWAEERRRLGQAHRRRVRRWSACLALLVVAVAISIALPAAPRLVWNASASAPVGLYLVRPGKAPHRGDTVIARVPVTVRTLAASRRYIPINVPLVKHVGGVAGTTICAAGNRVTIEGKAVAIRRVVDGAGRLMPWWTGCRRVRAGEVFLISPDVPASFDGRYFGISPVGDIIGTARPLWVR